MSSRLLLKSSGVADAVPDFSDLELSELCWNYRDGKLYGKTTDGQTEAILDLTSSVPSDIQLDEQGFLGRSSTGSGAAELLTQAQARSLLGSNHPESFDNSDLVSGVLTVTHNLGVQFPTGVAIYDNNNKKIGLPDDIEGVSESVMEIDLSSFIPITGTWTVSITI